MILPPSPTGEVWVAKIAVEAIVLALLIKRNLATKYLGCTVYLLVAVVKSLWLLAAMQQHGGYYPAFLRTQWLSIAAQAVLTLDLLVILASHFRGIRWFAVALYTVFASVALGFGLLISRVGCEWWATALQQSAGYAKHYGAACAILLILARLFFWLLHSRVRIARNARDASTAAILVMAGASAGHAVRQWVYSDTLTVFVPLVAFLWLAFRMRQSGEDAILPPPSSPEDRDKWNQQISERERQLVERARAASKF